MAFHRFVHYVAYSPKPLAAHDASALLKLQDHVAFPEFNVLQHELLLARGDAAGAAKLSERILDAWPGLDWKIERNERGRGFLQATRRSFGAESHRAKAPGAIVPYSELRGSTP